MELLIIIILIVVMTMGIFLITRNSKQILYKDSQTTIEYRRKELIIRVKLRRR